MEITSSKTPRIPAQGLDKKFLICKTTTRVLSLVCTLTAIGVMVSRKQTTEVLGFRISARYSYSSAFIYFVGAHATASVLSLLSLIYFLITIQHPKKFFFLFITDFIMTLLTITGFAAASTIGSLGMFGNIHTGWMPICINFGSFCRGVQTAIYFSFVATFLFAVQTVLSSYKQGQVQI